MFWINKDERKVLLLSSYIVFFLVLQTLNRVTRLHHKAATSIGHVRLFSIRNTRVAPAHLREVYRLASYIGTNGTILSGEGALLWCCKC